MDANENCATPQSAGDECEVRKLQEIVRKLERQNAELRKGQGLLLGSLDQAKVLIPNGVVPVNSNILRNRSDKIMKDEDDDHEVLSALDEIELIDVDQQALSDEDSWLYEYPSSLTSEQKAINLYKWLRTDVDDPNNTELQSAKRALVTKIENLIQASIVNRNQTPTLLKTYALSPERDAEPSYRLPISARLSFGVNAQSIDTRTFTRPKKSLKAVDLPVVEPLSVSPPKYDKHRLTPPPTPFLTDVSDIHTMARLQEECLRQSSPPPTSRRNSVASTSSQRSAKSLAMDHDNHEAALGNNKVMHTSTGTDSQHEESPKALSSRSSMGSLSPPISPHCSQYLEETRNSASGISKRNLPNLPRPYNGVNTLSRGSNGQSALQSSNFVAPNCDNRPANDPASRAPRYSMSPLRKVGAIPRSSSPATRLSSFPVRKSSQQVDDGVAFSTTTIVPSAPICGGLVSRIPKPRPTRSAIPTRATDYGKKVADESWKDGCY